MKTPLAACVLAALAACASAPPPHATLVPDAALAAAVQPGQATRDSVRAALGPASVQAFDSGYQVWLYQLPRPGGRYAEAVLLFGPDGVLRKTRRREPMAGEAP
jgi:hypothetical protein